MNENENLSTAKIEVLNFKEYEISDEVNPKDDTPLIFKSGNNLYDSLNVCLDFLNKAEENTYFYKWALLAIHNSLVEFMLTAIRGNNWRKVTKKNKIISTMSLYSIIEKEYFSKTKNNKKIKENIERLNDLRNSFAHPDYDIFITERSLLIKLFQNAIYIIEILVVENINIEKILSSDELINIKGLINKINNCLKF